MSGITNKKLIPLKDEQQNMSIGTLVTSKKTGLPMIGIVSGILDATMFKIIFEDHYNGYDYIWSMNYPNWKEKLVLMVIFQSPQRTLSKEEFDLLQNIRKNKLNIKYSDIPIVKIGVYPIDDLELYEDEWKPGFWKKNR